VFHERVNKSFLGSPVDGKEFLYFRRKLNKTQKEVAQLLGTSVKAVHSYEQGWRSVSGHIERQVLFLVSRKRGMLQRQKPCWVIKKCSRQRREKCPAWEFQAGHLCWFVNGTICEGTVKKDWKQKMNACRDCEVLSAVM